MDGRSLGAGLRGIGAWVWWVYRGGRDLGVVVVKGVVVVQGCWGYRGGGGSNGG